MWKKSCRILCRVLVNESGSITNKPNHFKPLSQSRSSSSSSVIPYYDNVIAVASSSVELHRQVSPDGEFGITQDLMMEAVENCPGILKVSPLELIYRIKNIQRYLNTSELQSMLSNTPNCLLMPEEKLNKHIKLVQDHTHVTTKELRALLVYAGTFFDDIDETRKKMDYLHLFMGIQDYKVDALMLLTKTDYSEMNFRHEFLSRRGQHFAPDRHGRTKIENPSLHAMFASSQFLFCENVAKCSEAEYVMFKKMLNHENKLLDKMLAGEDHEEDDDMMEKLPGLADDLVKYLYPPTYAIAKTPPPPL